MFSTLLGSLAPIARATAGEAIAETVAELETAGIELLSTGLAAADPALGAEAVVRDWTLAAEATTLPVKATLRGPYAARRDREAPLEAAADHVAEVVAALAEAGCPFVEIEEPDLAPIVASDAERERFVTAHGKLFAALGAASRGIHCSLTAGGGNLDGAGAATFFDLPYASFAFDLIDGPDNWRLIAAAPTDRGIICGALSTRANGDETPELLVWAAHYAASTGGRGLDRVGLANAGSLADLPRDVALRKLRRVAEAARIAATESPQELAALLDPRAYGRRRHGRGARVALEAPSERGPSDRPGATG